MPVNAAVRDRAERHKAAGGEVVLASASHRPVVEALAARHGVSPRVFASQPGHNLKGEAKARALVEAFGARGFDYAGNEKADLAIWRQADTALIVGRVPRAEAALAPDHPRRNPAFDGGTPRAMYCAPCARINGSRTCCCCCL